MTRVKPVDIQTQTLTIKFFSKVFSTNDYMKKYILKNADTNPKVRRNIKILKCFLAWKFNSRTNGNIDINELTAYNLTYNQAEIENYDLGLWQRHWTHQRETPPHPLNHKIQMQFRFSRTEEVYTFRLISGHCKLNSFLYKIWEAPSPRCSCGFNEERVEQCNMYNESREKWQIRGSLSEALQNKNLTDFVKETERFN